MASNSANPGTDNASNNNTNHAPNNVSNNTNHAPNNVSNNTNHAPSNRTNHNPPTGTANHNSTSSNRQSGTVKSFNMQTGWGMIEPNDEEKNGGNDVFVHRKDITAKSVDPMVSGLQQGESVEFEIGEGHKPGTVKAINVTGPGGENVRGQRRAETGWGNWGPVPPGPYTPREPWGTGPNQLPCAWWKNMPHGGPAQDIASYTMSESGARFFCTLGVPEPVPQPQRAASEPSIHSSPAPAHPETDEDYWKTGKL